MVRWEVAGLPIDEQEAGVHALEDAFLAGNPHIDYIDLLNQGYGLVEMTPSATTVDFRVIDTYDEGAAAVTKETFTVAAGELPEGICANAPTDPVDPTDPGDVDPADAAQPIAGNPTYTG